MAPENLLCTICQAFPAEECYSTHPIENLISDTPTPEDAEDLFFLMSHVLDLMPEDPHLWPACIPKEEALRNALEEQELNDIFEDVELPPDAFDSEGIAKTQKGFYSIAKQKEMANSFPLDKPSKPTGPVPGDEDDPIHTPRGAIFWGLSKIAQMKAPRRTHELPATGRGIGWQKYIDEVSELQVRIRDVVNDLEQARKTSGVMPAPDLSKIWADAIERGRKLEQELERRKEVGFLNVREAKKWVQELEQVNFRISLILKMPVPGPKGK